MLVGEKKIVKRVTTQYRVRLLTNYVQNGILQIHKVSQITMTQG